LDAQLGKKIQKRYWTSQWGRLAYKAKVKTLSLLVVLAAGTRHRY